MADSNNQQPLNPATNPPKPSEGHSITASVDVVSHDSLIAVLTLPPGLSGDPAVKWAQDALDAWATGTPYPTPNHETFGRAIDSMWKQTASRVLGVSLGRVLPTELVLALAEEARRDSRPSTLLEQFIEGLDLTGLTGRVV